MSELPDNVTDESNPKAQEAGAEPAAKPSVPPTVGRITIQDFKKIELRIGQVVSAEDHPNAEKLLILEVDLGTERIKIVAGLKAHYTPSDLMGKQIVVVTNMEPCKLRGVESNGMLLVASDGEKVAYLTPEKPVGLGGKVS